MTYPEDIDQAVIAFNACYYCGSVTHVAMNPKDCPAMDDGYCELCESYGNVHDPDKHFKESE